MADSDIIKDLVLESLDFLDSVEPKLIELQQAAEKRAECDPESINMIFRLFHSLKGGAGMLKLNNITELTHSAETMLDLFRTGKLSITWKHIDLLFQTTDLLRAMLTSVDENLTDVGFESQVEKLVKALSQLIGKGVNKEKANTVRKINTAEEKTEDTVLTAKEKDRTESKSPVDANEDIEIPITSEMMERFVQESYDLLDEFEQNLLSLEKLSKEKSCDQETAHSAFRLIHSFKGNCGFMGLKDIESLSHRMETVLDYVKTEAIDPNPEVFQFLLSWVDLLRFGVAEIAKDDKGQIPNCSQYICQVEELIMDWIRQKSSSQKQEKILMQSSTVQHSQMIAPIVKALVQRQDLRVDIRKLDTLVNLVGELVIAEAMLTRHPAIANHEDEGVERAVHHLRRISRDLQDVAMSVRMIPLATTFQKMIRLVHDLCSKSGKKVNLQLLGEDTEVDKTVIEHIADPLVHIVRNALDHGVELPEERLRKGKQETGNLIIEGKHEGGEIWITITDDGRGINREKILKKAIEKGLIDGDGEGLSDNQLFKLIFEPGFTTAEKVSDVSGRGVGLDVVKKNIEKLKGRIDIRSKQEEGAMFILRIPLTLAIIEGMLVRVGSTSYTIPLLGIKESIRPTHEQITTTPDGQEIVRIRDDFYPVVRIHKLFQKHNAVENLEDGILVLVEAEGHVIALFVDEIIGQQETVIKGLSEYLAKAKGVSGCTILGNGEISLIVDVGTIVSSMKSPYGETVEAAGFYH